MSPPLRYSLKSDSNASIVIPMAQSTSLPSSGGHVEAGSTTPTPVTTSLLTRWTPSSYCQTTFWQVRQVGILAHSPPAPMLTATFGKLAKGCALPTATQRGDTQVPIVYSPGVCRSDYIPVSTITDGPRKAVTSLCCYEGLTLITTGGDWQGSCGRLFQTGNQVIFQDFNGSTTPTVVSSFYFVDMPYTVAWKSAELDLFTPTSLPLTISAEASSLHRVRSLRPVSYSSVGAPAIVSKGSPPPSGLTGGQQAGIGLGAAVAGVAIGAILTWLLFLRKRRREDRQVDLERPEAQDSDETVGQSKYPEVSTEERPIEAPANEKAVEMYADVGAEFPQDDAAREADNDMRHELDANYRGEELTDIATPVDGTPAANMK